MNASRARAIFMELVADVPPEQWDRRLAELAGADEELRGGVARLLAAHRQEDSFLERPPLPFGEAAEETVDRPRPEQAGTQIGPYKLLQQIGEGGMGFVFMAEQKEPVKRRVALKIVKPGMDTQQVIARFEAERQALALMDHPNIARVLDVGTTETGLPYFVMELVKGHSITTYCDEHRLTTKERLELMVPICQAVQHAHQKGIIHRDLKPSNVLVAQYDHQAVPKIIDFGVAKALNQQLTEKTLFTQYGQIVGTIEYMSPEQARFNQLDIDTRTDIYSLGVLLYELLTGSTPFDKTRLRSVAFDEMMRIIREEEPPRPSVRLSTIETLSSVAASRKSDPQKLSLLVRGELDWIVMKAMDKDRSRRYESATGLADDVKRFLRDEPVAACPPSAAYRFRKFARRNATALATGALVSAALLCGLIGTTWQAVRATQERDRALHAETAANLETEARESAEASRALAELAERNANEQLGLAEGLRQEAVSAASRARATESVLAELVRNLFTTAQGPREVEHNLNARYDLHWAMAALAHVTQQREERIANLEACIALATQQVNPLETRLENADGNEIATLLADLNIARGRFLRAQSELAALGDQQARQAALRQNVINHVQWWRVVHKWNQEFRRGGEADREADARCRLCLASAAAIAGGVELADVAASGELPPRFVESQSDQKSLLKLAISAGEMVCEVHQANYQDAEREERLVLLSRIVDGLATLSQARIAFAKLSESHDGQRAALESQAAALKELVEGLKRQDSSGTDDTVRGAHAFAQAHYALVELQLMRLSKDRPHTSARTR